MVGAIRRFINVRIGVTSYPALVNTETIPTRINNEVLSHVNFLQQQLNLLPATYPGLVKCDIHPRRRRNLDHHFMYRFNWGWIFRTVFRITIERVNVNNRSTALANSHIMDFENNKGDI